MSSLTHNGNINCGSITKKNNWCCGTKEVVTCYTKEKNTNSKLVKFEKLLKKIWRHKKFLFNVMRARKMARSYYNSHKNFCISYNMSEVSCGSGRLTLYLNYPDCNSPEISTLQNYNKYTYLMRVVPRLPYMWSCTAKGNPFPKLSSWKNYVKESGKYTVLPFCNPQNAKLEKNEIILKQYLENADFFTDLFSSFNFSVSSHNSRKEYCKIFKVPGFLSSDCLPYKVRLSGDQLRMLQCMLLRNAPSMISKKKLPYFNNNVEGCNCNTDNNNNIIVDLSDNNLMV